MPPAPHQDSDYAVEQGYPFHHPTRSSHASATQDRPVITREGERGRQRYWSFAGLVPAIVRQFTFATSFLQSLIALRMSNLDQAQSWAAERDLVDARPDQ